VVKKCAVKWYDVASSTVKYIFSVTGSVERKNGSRLPSIQILGTVERVRELI
jgi:hypothetical protein